MEPTFNSPTQQPPVGAPSLQPIATKPRRNNRMSSIIAVAVVVVIAAAGYGISTVHAQSAPSTLKAFYNDFFSYKFDDAFNLLCPDKQASVKPSFDTLKAQFQQFEGSVTIDTSKLQYDLNDSGLTSADVHVHGSVGLSNTQSGQSVPPITFDEVDPMALNGLNWCVNIDEFATK